MCGMWVEEVIRKGLEEEMGDVDHRVRLNE